MTVAKEGLVGADSATDGRMIFVASVLVTGLLYAVPYANYLAYPLLLLSTMVHELGHGVAAVLAGGDFDKFVMYSDGSGVASLGGLGRVGSAFSSAGGLVGPAVAAAIGFIAARRNLSARIFLGVLGVLLIVAEIMVVRNLFGLVFVGAIAAICVSVAAYGGEAWSRGLLVLLAVQLALSVYSRGDYLFTEFADTAAGKMPSDVAQMGQALGGPYWFWGAVCAAFSAVVVIFGGWMLLRGGRSR